MIETIETLRKMSSLSWSDSYDKRTESLKKHGFRDYKDYLDSDYWRKTTKDYASSRLLKECMVCRDRQYLLHHTDYQFICNERLDLLLPLCKDHHRCLHDFLLMNGISLELSSRAIPLCNIKFNYSTINRKLLTYRKCLVEYKAGCMGMRLELSKTSIGRKRSNKKDMHVMVFSDDNRRVSVHFRVNTGEVYVGTSQNPLNFDDFLIKFYDNVNNAKCVFDIMGKIKEAYSK